jgi:DNA-binding transcriptional MerR regulator
MEQTNDTDTDILLNNKKTYYSIREVCDKLGLESHVLRYWESEFPQLHPKKNRAGNRAYRDKDIETIQRIKHLLYEEQYTIPGAKKKLSEVRPQKADEVPVPATTPDTGLLSDAIRELKDLQAILQK